MHWLWFALIGVIASSISALFPRLIMKHKDKDPVVFTIIVQTCNGLLCFFVALFFGFHIPPVSLWPLFLISGALYAYGTLFFFTAAKKIEASEISILTGAGAIVPIVIAFLLLAERLSILQWLGVLLVLIAVILVQYNRNQFQINQGALYALVGTTTYGIAVVIDGIILRSFDIYSFLPIIFLLTSIVLCVAYPKRIPLIIREVRKFNILVGAYSIMYVISAQMFYATLKNGAMISQITTISRASIILTVLCAMVFLKERSHPWKKLFGAILTTIGIMLIK